MLLAGHVARMGKKKSVHRALAWSVNGKEHLEEICSLGNNIKMAWHELHTRACEQGQVAVPVYTTMNLRVSSNAANFLTRRGSVSFLGRHLLRGFS